MSVTLRRRGAGPGPATTPAARAYSSTGHLRRLPRPRLAQLIPFTLGTAWLVIVVAPIWFMVLSSFRTEAGYLTKNPWVPTSGMTLSEYSLVFRSGLGTYFLNSGVVAAASIVLTLALSLATSFRAVRRTSPRVSGWAIRLLVFGLAVPIQALIVPLYIIVIKLHLYNTLPALILTMSATAIPLSVLVMLSFVRDIPRELIDAMGVDGAGEWRIFSSLIVPMSRPVLATMGIYDGIQVWNNFLLPLVLTTSNSVAVLPLGLYKFQGMFGTNIPATLTAVLLSAVPLFILYIVLRRQFVQGLSGVAVR
ncbi:MAG: carbohydrate ABC transporter permease [Acidimicrobiales bacterium]